MKIIKSGGYGIMKWLKRVKNVWFMEEHWPTVTPPDVSQYQLNSIDNDRMLKMELDIKNLQSRNWQLQRSIDFLKSLERF